MTPDWLRREVLRSVFMCAPGPHVFLLVVPISKAFTEKDLKAVVDLLRPFGEGVWRHCMVLFTWKDWLNNSSIEEYIATEGQDLKWLVEKCGNRYHVLTCNRFYDSYPVIEMFQKVVDMITRNNGLCFTTEENKQKVVQRVLTEEQWNSRQQELIDRMLKAVAQEPEEPTVPPVKMAASLDGAFIPSSEFNITPLSESNLINTVTSGHCCYDLHNSTSVFSGRRCSLRSWNILLSKSTRQGVRMAVP